MSPSSVVVRLVWIIAALILVAAGAGVFVGGGGGAAEFISLHGERVALYGQGLYRFDTLLTGPGFQGQDAVMLVVGLPLLLIALRRYQSGSAAGVLLLAGTLMYVLYAYTSMAFGTAYNPMFPAYVALFSAALFALVTLLASVDVRVVSGAFTDRVPRRVTATLLFVVGAVLLAVWGGLSLLPAALGGQAPVELASYTTLVTHVLDLGLIVPSVLLTGVLLRRQVPLGDVLALPLLLLSSLMGLTIAVATGAQLLAGYPYTTGQVVTLVMPFVLLAVAGLWLALRWLRSLPASQGQPQPA